MSHRVSFRRALPAGGLAALMLLASCTITDSTGDAASAADARKAFGGSPSSAPGSGGTTGGSGTGAPAATSTTKPTAGAAALTDPTADAVRVGTVPSYADIVAARVRGGSRSVRFTLSAAAALPGAMPDASTTMSVGFRLKVGDVPYVIVAKASIEGWSLSATKNGAPASNPGTITVEGTNAVIVVPWAFFSGPHAFRWTGYLGWNQSAAVKSYAFDIAPNYGETSFPAA